MAEQKMESFETFICYPILMMSKKSMFRNCSMGMVVFIEQREILWIIVGLTCGLDNLFSLMRLFLNFVTSDCDSSFLCCVPSYMP